jgi:hypothetical protein
MPGKVSTQEKTCCHVEGWAGRSGDPEWGWLVREEAHLSSRDGSRTTYSGTLKDRLQEVPKGQEWSRRYLSFPGNFSLHLRDISALRQYSKRL